MNRFVIDRLKELIRAGVGDAELMQRMKNTDLPETDYKPHLELAHVEINTEASPTKLDMALRCQRAGWWVFPLGVQSKQPDGALAPNGFKSASNDVGQITSWWTASPSANIGVDLGRSNLTVLDFDKGTPPAELNLQDAFQVKTSRGTHVYFDGVSKQGKMSLNGEVLGDIKSDGGYTLAPSSIHPDGSIYTIMVNKGISPLPDGLIERLCPQRQKFKNKTEGWRDAPFIHHNIHNQLVQFAGHYVQNKNINDADELYILLEAKIEKNGCFYEDGVTPFPCDMKHVREIAQNAVASWKTGEEKRKQATLALTQSALSVNGGTVLEATGERLSHDVADEYSEASIPPFDPSVIKGIYKEIVDVTTKGTTLAPQFVYAIAKAVVGAKMAGKVKFQDLDVEPLIYLAMCGSTGSGKGEAWRRVLRILTAKLPESMPLTSPMSCNAGIKILNSADSGAGLKDAFFENPADQPIVLYIDEVKSLGHKAGEKKNPEIIDTMGELADSTSITRAKAKKSNRQSSAKTKDNAYLTVVMCGQNGEVYTSAFAGRTDVGWWDRLTPEHGVPQETGKLPPISDMDATELLRKLNNLPYSGTMGMVAEAESLLEQFWAAQSPEVRKVARLKKHLQLDAYLMAFGRGVMTVEKTDMEDAIKNFVRQLAIRRVMFRGEAPDRVGFYLGLIKGLTEWMRQRLAEGRPPELVARSRWDYETKTNARRNNEEHIFERAMDTHAKHHLYKVPVKAKNGHIYEKYLPIPLED